MLMPLQSIGRIGLSASALAMGCEPLGGTDWGPVHLSDAVAAVRASWDAGVTVFDTADVYGLGESERRLSAALEDHRHSALIVSKFGVRWQAAAGNRASTWKDSSPEYLVRALEASLRRLRLERLPVYLVHWPSVRTPLDDTIGELDRQRQAGKIGEYGVSNFWHNDMLRAIRLGSAVSELPLNLIDRRAVRELEVARREHVAVLAYGAYAQGLLCGRYDRQTTFAEDDRRSRLAHFTVPAWDANEPLLRLVARIATDRGVPMAAVALRWVLSHTAVTSAIVSMRSPVQVNQALQAFGWTLADEELDALQRAAPLNQRYG